MMSEVTAGLTETINGMKVVKSFGKERAENRMFVGRLRPTFDVHMSQCMNNAFLWICSECISISCTIIVLGVGGTMVIRHQMNIGELVAYYTYFSMLTGPISALSGLSSTISEGMVSVERLSKLLDAIPEIQEAENPKSLENAKGHLSFEHVSFGYEKDKPVLRDFTLDVPPGKKIALVGPSGSGKSTIASLLMRFFDVSSGVIKIDGVNLKEISFESLRNNVGIVLQDSFLFSGTIEDNIRYGRETATHEEVVAAAKMANAHNFIMEQSKGYNSPVGENGVMLSGGQKQRIAIARAILKNPSVLVLDEATSALDTMSEAVVQEALDKLMENRTTVIIAHRLSTVRNSDVICVLKDGVVEEQGSHTELLLKEGLYRELYAMQLKERNNVKSDLFAAGEGSSSAV